MGDIADMMLDGTMCSSCGEFLGEDTGYPMMCHDCQKDYIKESKAEIKAQNITKNALQKKTACPKCGKRVKEVGLSNHMRDKHNEHV